jgi:L-2-hydroxyglutarate oxidase LhgO
VADSGPAADVVVIGAGVVGLAVAAALSRSGRSVLILERNGGIAQEVSSRNSQVIHAGIYYPKESAVAALCARGRELLYARCEAHRIPHRKLGKLIVACDESELGKLEEVHGRAAANGVPGLSVIDGDGVRALEPAVRARAALVSPETGIVDAHSLALSYLAEAEAHDAVLLTDHEIVSLHLQAGGWRVEVCVTGESTRQELTCGVLVNAAGLGCDRVAELAGLDPDALGYRLHPCKGDYFALAPGRKVKVDRLVYPLPQQAGLGIHTTIDMGGRIGFGPDTEFVDTLDYRVDPAKAEAFARAISRYLPMVEADWLVPDFAGIRPKLSAPGEGFRDFVIREESDAGRPGLINLVGIESPGLTAAGAIAERVCGLVSG